MSTTDNVYIKKHAIVDLEVPVAAANIDDNFDAIFAALREIQTAVNSTGTGGNALLDGVKHTDTVASTPTVGAIIYANASALWASLIAGTNTAVLRLVAGLPSWVVLTSLDFLHNLLSATHSDTAAAAVVHGDVIRGEAITSGLTDTTKFWGDGACYDGISGAVDPTGGKYWGDGAVMAALVSGATVSATLWRRVSGGSQDQVLTMDSGLPSWKTPGAANVGTGARAYSTANQALTYNNPDVVTLNATEFDTSSYWSAGTPNRFTAAVAGYYVVIGQITMPRVISGLVYAQIWVSGTMKASNQIQFGNVDPAYGDYDPKQVSTIVHLNAGDYVELRALTVRFTGVPSTTIAGANYTWLSMMKVG